MQRAEYGNSRLETWFRFLNKFLSDKLCGLAGNLPPNSMNDQCVEEEIPYPSTQIQTRLALNGIHEVDPQNLHTEEFLWQLGLGTSTPDSFNIPWNSQEAIPRHQTLNPKFAEQMPPSVQNDIVAAISSFNLRKQQMPITGINFQFFAPTLPQSRESHYELLIGSYPPRLNDAFE